MGSGEFGVPTLTALCEAHDVRLVITQPDRPAGRGGKMRMSPIKELALQHNIPVFQPLKMKAPETEATLAGYDADVAIVAAYGRILPKALLEAPRHGCLNVHASLLPKHRGASPIPHAILAGDKRTGVCLMRMDEGLDTGPVYARREVEIANDDTTESLSVKLSQLGAALTVECVRDAIEGRLEAMPQPEDGVSYAPLLKKSDGAIDCSAGAVHAERQIRALWPWPVAYLVRGEDRIQIGRGRVDPRPGKPGVVEEISKEAVRLGCGEDSLWLEQVKPPGRRMMDAPAWVSGRGVALGDRFHA